MSHAQPYAKVQYIVSIGQLVKLSNLDPFSKEGRLILIFQRSEIVQNKPNLTKLGYTN